MTHMHLRWVVVATALAATSHACATTVELPFDLVRDTVIVHVQVDGHGPLAMILDTGADPSVIDLATARRLGMKIDARGEQGDGTGTDVNLAYSTRVRTLGLGTLTVRRLQAVAMDLSAISRSMGIPVDGVLGRSLMKGRVFQIDYLAHKVRFYTASPLSGRGRAPDTPQRTTLHYHYRDDLLIGGVRIDGRAAVANLDTGSNSTFQFTPEAVAQFGLSDEERRGTPSVSTGFNGKAENLTGHVDRVDVGSLAIVRPAVVFLGRGTGRDDAAWAVRVGGGFLKDYVVTVDDVAHLVRIEKP